MATIKDVAREVGLSVTTVSRALNNYDDVAEATRRRVQAVADRLDYHPNAVARSLQGCRANTVGLVIPSILHRSYDAFWSEFIGGVAGACAGREVDLLVAATGAGGRGGGGRRRPTGSGASPAGAGSTGYSSATSATRTSASPTYRSRGCRSWPSAARWARTRTRT